MARNKLGDGRASMACVLLLGVAGWAVADEAKPSVPSAAPTWSTVAGPQYKAGPIHKFFLGSGYRRLWATQVQVEVLDLASFSGGLTPEKKGGGKQTVSLRFKGADGREWKFRSVDKDPSAIVPKPLRDRVVDRVVEDQIGASLPAACLVVDPLADAAEIVHVNSRLVAIPDDPRLGEFRKEFAGMLGTLEEKPSVDSPVTPGFDHLTRIVSGDDFPKLLDADPLERVDARAFLNARLLDMLIGDYDRHIDQFDWAKDSRSGRWVPVAKDRDLAFVKFDGLFLTVARKSQPRLVNFGSSYPDITGLNWQGRFLDRRHLTELEWPTWQEVIAELQAKLTDGVIDDAVRRLPTPYYRMVGTTLSAQLKVRRAQLPTAARRYYELLTREPEITATDQADNLRILRQSDGSVDTILTGSNGPYFRRRFRPSETKEIRVYLKDGNDRVVVEGDESSAIKVRVVGGNGNDRMDGARSGQTRFYDTVGDGRVIRVPYTQPLDREGDPQRDWGGSTTAMPWFRAGDGLGLVLGAQLTSTAYGFRKHPHEHEHALRLGYSTRTRAYVGEYEYESLRIDSKQRFHVLARVSELDLIRFYGIGNETAAPEADAFYEVRQRHYTLAPSYRLDITGLDVSIGPVFKFADTRRLFSPGLIAQQQPYGVGDFSQLGARLGLNIDRRDDPSVPSKGMRFSTEGAYYPRLWSITDQFGEVHGTLAVYATAPMPLSPTLALRVGGQKVWGEYPFFEAAYIGGTQSVRGLPSQRYAGDASAFGNAELRLALMRREGSVGTGFGILGFTDTGRVFVTGETSNRWHVGGGGGLWLRVGKHTATLAAARSEGHLRIYGYGGFVF